MIVRDVDGKLVIISRNDCRNETVYNEKIYNIRLAYGKKYKSISYNKLNNFPKDFYNKIIKNINISKNSSYD
jgi:hypothetical protein